MPEPVQDPSRGNVSTRNAGEGDVDEVFVAQQMPLVEADPLKVSKPEAGVGCKKEAAQ